MRLRVHYAVVRALRVLGVLLVAGLLAAPPVRADAGSPVALSFKNLQGKRVHVSDYRNQVVVLNFWATWCPPCRAELPLLLQAQHDYASKGVVILGVSLDDKHAKKDVEAFVKKQDLDFSIWVGASADDLKTLDMGQAIPATAFIDRDGRIVARILGQMRSGEIQERLDWLLSDRTGPPPRALVTHLDGP